MLPRPRNGGRTAFAIAKPPKAAGRGVVRMSASTRTQLEEAPTRERPSGELVETMEQALDER